LGGLIRVVVVVGVGGGVGVALVLSLALSGTGIIHAVIGADGAGRGVRREAADVRRAGRQRRKGGGGGRAGARARRDVVAAVTAAGALAVPGGPLRVVQRGWAWCSVLLCSPDSYDDL